MSENHTYGVNDKSCSVDGRIYIGLVLRKPIVLKSEDIVDGAYTRPSVKRRMRLGSKQFVAAIQSVQHQKRNTGTKPHRHL